MKIVSCPKGGKIPEGYCRQSCLNYSAEHKKEPLTSVGRLKNLFAKDGRAWLQIYKEEIATHR